MKKAALIIVVIGLCIAAGWVSYMWFYSQGRYPEDRPGRPGSTVVRGLMNLSVAQDSFKIHGNKNLNSDGDFEFGTMEELLAAQQIDRAFFKPHGPAVMMNTRGYLFKIHMPADPSDAGKYFCAIAWPLDPNSPSDWPSFFVDRSGKVYESTERVGNAAHAMPELNSIHTGKPYVSPISLKLWREQTQRP